MPSFQVDTERHAQLDCWRVHNAHAELLIAKQGAQILGYQRTGEPPLLWLSDEAMFVEGRSVRGGVPVCWPWFGVFERNPQSVQDAYEGGETGSHGLARTRDWTLAGSEDTARGIRLTFALSEARGQLPGWPHDVDLQLVIELGDALSVRLVTKNLGDDPVTFSQALHSYFAVSDVHQVELEGVDGLDYVETLADWEIRAQTGALTFAGETDRIYLNAPQHLHIVDAGWQRRVTVSTEGSRSAVVWNPWRERALALPDMADDGWQGMLCVETANVLEDVVTLNPGERHALALTIKSTPLDT